MVGTEILSNNMRSPSPECYTPSGWLPSIVTPSITPIFDPMTDLDLTTEFDFLPNCERFPKNICNGCGMPTEDAYSSRHLVLSLVGTCKCSNVETNLSWTCLIFGLLSFEHPSVFLFFAFVALFWFILIPYYFGIHISRLRSAFLSDILHFMIFMGVKGFYTKYRKKAHYLFFILFLL